MIFKFLGSDFSQLPWGVDVTSDLTTININNTMSNGSTITATAPYTETTREWVTAIRETMLNDSTGNDFVIMANTLNIQDYFVIDSVEVSENKSKGQSTVTITGYSADKLLQTRLSPKKEYSGLLSVVLEDLIKSAGLGGVHDGTYPISLNGEDASDRYIPFITLDLDLTEDATISLSTTNSATLEHVSDLVQQYGLRMYSVYEELRNKLVIKIENAFDKTVTSTGLKNLISSDNNSITEFDYKIDRNERINFLYVQSGDGTITPKAGSSANNIASGLNRREEVISATDAEDVDSFVNREFAKSEDALEKINIKGQFGEGFGYGLSQDEVFVGDKITFSLYDDRGDRYMIDDYLTEMSITIDTKTSGSSTPTYMPTIGFSEVDEGEYVTRRQKIRVDSNKRIQNSNYKNVETKEET